MFHVKQGICEVRSEGYRFGGVRCLLYSCGHGPVPFQTLRDSPGLTN